jgi:asparagine synthase (glutamine-hydrolysing)
MHSAEGNELKKWCARDWESYDALKDNASDLPIVRKALGDATHRQLMRLPL